MADLRLTSHTSESLLECVTLRLAHQHAFLTDWLQYLPHGSNPSFHNAKKRLETLQFVHGDTYKLCRQLLNNRSLWERFSNPDRHVTNATFLELRARHANTIEAVVDVVTGLNSIVDEGDDLNKLHDRANTFLQQRLGIQLLCDHHVELYKGKKPNGAVSVDAPLAVVLADAIQEASHIVDAHLQIFPETIFPNETEITCTMIQPWAHHALVELLKNSMAASVAQMKLDRQEAPVPIRIHVDRTESNVTLDIVDRGTGIRDISGAFRLGHSSSSKKWDRLDEQQSYAAVRSPLSSLGVGLPVSRYMLEHLGGSLTLENNSDGGGGCTARARFSTNDTMLERKAGEVVETQAV